ncbi:MAG: S41 family peptidase [Dehalococcoidia bacterium]|nr:S41 family peptidase [Dehalococcoidia bacterium]
MAALIGVLLVASGFLVRVVTEPASTVTPAATAVAASPGAGADSWAILAEIARVLQSDFVEPEATDTAILQEGAIRGLFEALNDPHSTYIDPDTFALSKDDFEGAFQGIGATVSQQDGFIVIVQPLPATPAERAGLRAGDIILQVDGESAEGWSVEQAVLRIRGPIGTTVSLTIRHGDGVVETLDIERDAIEVASVSTAPPGGVLRDADGNTVTDIGYIRISSYTRTTPQELEDAITAAEAAGVRGLILDVRSNPGGLLQETVQIADMLLDGGDIVTQVERDGSERTASARPGMITALPIVVVQDGFSASGAELMAAALQENGRAQVVGEPSFGKGTVNRAIELSNGGAVYVSIARWLTPARNQIEGRGVIPDVEVTLTIDDIDASRDVAVIRSIELLRATP